MPNLHSHAFQRALIGRTQVAGLGEDTFWLWRKAMYASLDRLDPDEVAAVARWPAVELLDGGFTGIAEPHCVHHQRDGTPYGNPAELGQRTLAALRSAGLSVAMLPVLYAHSGFGGQAPGACTRGRVRVPRRIPEGHVAAWGRVALRLGVHDVVAVEVRAALGVGAVVSCSLAIRIATVVDVHDSATVSHRPAKRGCATGSDRPI